MKKREPELSEHNVRQRQYFKAADKRTMLPESTPYNERQARELMAFGAIKPGERVLEVGCGMGRHAFCLAEQGIRVDGLDLSPELVDRLHEFDGGRYNLRTYVGDVLDYSKQLADTYDAVIGFFMLHHLERDLSVYFLAMQNMLKPGGRLVFMEPNPHNPLYYLQVFLTPGMSWQAEKGIAYMREKNVRRAMQSAGLTGFACTRLGFFPRGIANREWGRRLEQTLERVNLWRGLLPFQLFKAYRPE